MASSGISGKKKKSGKKLNKKTTGQPIENSRLLSKEIIVWVVLGISILLLLSNFGLCGKIGLALSSFLFGMGGLIAWVFPFFLFFIVLFLLSNRGNGIAYVKAGAIFLIGCMLSTFMSLISGDFDSALSLGDYYQISAVQHKSGGLIGGMFARVFATAFGKVGAYVIVFVIMIICVVLISEKSILSGLKKGGKKAYGVSRKKVEEHSERRKEARADKMYDRRLQEIKRQKLADYSDDDFDDEEEFYFDEDFVEDPANFGDTRELIFSKKRRKRRNQNSSMKELTLSVPEVEKETEEQEELPELKATVHEPEKAESLLSYDLKDNTGTFRESAGGAAFSQKPRHTEKIVSKNPIGSSIVSLSEEDYYRADGYIEPDQYKPVFHRSDADTLAEQKPEEYSESEIYPESETYSEQEIYPEPEVYSEPETYSEPEAYSELEAYSEPEAYTQSGNYAATGILPGNRSDSMRNDRLPDEDKPIRKNRKTAETRSDALEAEKLVAREIASKQEFDSDSNAYRLPPISLLTPPSSKKKGMSQRDLDATARKLKETLESFGVGTTITNVCCGPSVTRYELQPDQGVKVSRILNLADDIKLNLAAADIRIEAPIPGKAAVGIEVPNSENSTVTLYELLDSPDFRSFSSKIGFAVGRDIGGNIVIADIFKMPHLLIGGATGSGKSVCINTLIMSILYKAKPDEVKFIMIDPKMIELNLYNGIPHLYIPVVTDPKKAAGALQWAVAEMTKRYQLFAALGVRDLKGFNSKIETMEAPEGAEEYKKMPQIVIVVDEFADLMMVASGEVEEAVCRLAQLARAAGIHLILATQRPSVDVITGLIKANMPSRIALAVSSGVDSRTIIDMIGAEKLLGKGDMLFYPSGLPKPIRVQGAFVSERDVERVVDFIKNQSGEAQYDENVKKQIEANAVGSGKNGSAITGVSSENENERDAYFEEAARFIVEKEKASIGSLQRVFKIGFNRAARIMDQLCDAGVVGPEEGTKPRKVLMSMEKLERFLAGDYDVFDEDYDDEEGGDEE